MISAFVRYIPLLLLACVWEVATLTHLVSPSLLPPVSEIAAEGVVLILDPSFYHHVFVSLGRALSGLAIAIFFGVCVGVLMARLNAVRIVLNPLVQMFYPLPKSALIPVMIVWLGIGSLSKIVLIAIGCMVPIIISSYNGARGVDPFLVWSARSLGSQPKNILWEIILPSAMPQIASGIRTALASCFLLLVASELLISTDGLGHFIGLLGENGNYPTMFAVIFVVVAMGFAADRLFLILTNKYMAWAAI